MTLQLTTEERRILVDVLNLHMEGMDDARERMIEDSATLNSFETFSETLQQHDIDKRTIENIKEKVLNYDDECVD